MFENKYLKNKKYVKVRDHSRYTWECRGAAHSICNVKYNAAKKISTVFHIGVNCDYHFIMKELAEGYMFGKELHVWEKTLKNT